MGLATKPEHAERQMPEGRFPWRTRVLLRSPNGSPDALDNGAGNECAGRTRDIARTSAR